MHKLINGFKVDLSFILNQINEDILNQGLINMRFEDPPSKSSSGGIHH